MKFISYAQNFEDVMLWRALHAVEKGFYIDIGAWSPDIDSVTKAFYERGWKGINAEPNLEFYKQLQDRRSHDINLQIAVGDQEDVLVMYFLSGSGLSTLDYAIAKNHQFAGWEIIRSTVQVQTLKSIWDLYVPPQTDVHFLKVDVEGYEGNVLRGNDWANNRPWIVVVEATLPMTQIESHNAWESILLKAGYKFVYEDGLNRFYVANEHTELEAVFKYPPNVFDDFVLRQQQEAETRAIQALVLSEQAEGRATEAEARATQADARATQAEGREAEVREQVNQSLALVNQAHALAEQAEARVDRLEANHGDLIAQLTQTQKELHNVHQSNHHHWLMANDRQKQLEEIRGSISWRLTAPLRWLGKQAQFLARSGLVIGPKHLLQHAWHFAERRPRIKRITLWVLHRHPDLMRRLKIFVRSPVVEIQQAVIDTMITQPTRPAAEADLAYLTPHARRIFNDLKVAIAQKHPEHA